MSNILKHWENENVQSMYDKNLLKLEVDCISDYLNTDDIVLDAGCGEAETTRFYATKCKSLVAADYSDTRLNLALKNIDEMPNVNLNKVDFTREIPYNRGSFDVIISQRFLINIPKRNIQFEIIRKFFDLLKKRGRLLLLEGFNDGTHRLNTIRKKLGLNDIPIKWHNLFFDDIEFEKEVRKMGFHILTQKDFSLYFLLTRAINAKLKFPEIPTWNDEINNIGVDLNELVELNGLSRLKFYSMTKISE